MSSGARPGRGQTNGRREAGLTLGLLAAIVGFSSLLVAEEASPEIRGDESEGFELEGEHATGDPEGLRSALESRGLSVAASSIFESTAAWSGGRSSRESSRRLFTLDLELDLERLAGIPGGTVFLQYLSVTAERGGSADAGDIQIFSNLENDRSLDVIYELWYEQRMLENRIRLKVGKVDANSEFAVVAVAGDFASSSAGFSPTIVGFPSYPDPATSINVFCRLTEHLEVAYGFHDGATGASGVRTGSRGPSSFFSNDASDDLFHIGEATLTQARLLCFRDARLTLGGWFHTGEFARFDGSSENDTGGIHGTLEGRILDFGISPDRGLHGFLQYGWADESVSVFEHHMAGGLVAHGPWPRRPRDRAGIYASFVSLSGEPGAGFADDELAIDAYYRCQLAPFAWIQLEVQHISNPSGDPRLRDAWIGGLRLGVDL